jgi:hypothetical protein
MFLISSLASIAIWLCKMFSIEIYLTPFILHLSSMYQEIPVA